MNVSSLSFSKKRAVRWVGLLACCAAIAVLGNRMSSAFSTPMSFVKKGIAAVRGVDPAVKRQDEAVRTIVPLVLPYSENFDGIGTALPTGWTVRTGATATALGTSQTFTTTATSWADTAGRFKNFASTAGLVEASSTTDQTNSTNRALGIRQTGTFGDSGAAFTYQRDTTGETVGNLSFDALMLSVQPRSTTWTVQYGVGAAPTSFVTLATYTDPGVWGSTPISVTLNPTDSAAVSNQSSVFFRIVALATSTGSGNRDSFGIDNFSLTAGGGGGNQPIVTNCPTPISVTFGSANSGPVSASDTDGTVTSAVIQSVTPTDPGTISLTGFTPAGAVGGTASATLSVGSTTPAGNYSVTIQWSNNDSPTPQTANCVVAVNVTPPVSVIPINQIQGAGTASPLVGSTVTTTGIVTGLRSNGFYLQTPDANIDGNPNTSEAIFIFTSSAPPGTAAIGNAVNVTGSVAEFISTSAGPLGPNSPSSTQLTGPTVALLSTGNPLPNPIVLTTADTNPSGGFTQLEKFEHMRVRINSMTVVAPTDGNVNEPNATSTSNGVFFGVVTGIARPFREQGIAIQDPLPSGAPCCIPRYDANPETIRVDSDGQPGAAAIDVTVGATVSNIVGPLDPGGFKSYTLYPDAATPPTTSGGISTFVPVPVPGANDLTIASTNLERFFDTTNDPAIGEPVLTPTAFANRLAKVSLMIRNVLRRPDVIGLQEVENLTTAQAIANQVNTDAGTPGDYTAFLVEGNDVGGIDVGFLVRTSRISVVDVTQFGLNTVLVNPDSSTDILNDRPPLVLRATVPSAGGFAFTVIVNHLRSLNDVDSTAAGSNGWPTAGARVRAKRQQQAEFLANLIQSRQTANPSERIIVLGDMNAFQFNDGLVDSIGTIRGVPTPNDQVTLASADLVNPDLINLLSAEPPAERYSFSFDGSAQVLDHVLITQNLLPAFLRVNHARTNADFSETFRNNPSVPMRLSDHDPVVAAFALPPTPAPPVTITVNPATLPNGQVGTAYSQTLTATGGTGPYTFTLISGSLPPGLSLTSGGVLNGTPTTSVGSPFGFTVQAVDAGSNVGTRAYSLTVQQNASSTVNLAVTSTAYTGTPTPGFFDGDFTINTTLTNNGVGATPLNGPFAFRVTTLTKVGPDQNPSQPNRLRTADDFVLATPGTGVVGSQQSANFVSLGIGSSRPVSFTIGIGSRQSFSFFVDLLAVAPNGGPVRTVQTFRFTVDENFVVRPQGTVVADQTFDQTVGTVTPLFGGAGVQTSPVVTVDPASSSRLAVAASDITSRQALLKISGDGGVNWREVALPRSVNGVNYFSAQNPAVSFGGNGEMNVAYTLGNLNDAANALVWTTVGADGTVAAPRLIASAAASAQTFLARPAIATQGTATWVAWEQIASLNKGETSLLVQQVAGAPRQMPSLVTRGQVGAPTLAFSPKGPLFLGWEDRSGAGTVNLAAAESGAAFGPARTIAVTGMGAGRFIPAMPEQGVRANLQLAVDQNGILSAAYTGAGTGLDVFLTQSSDNGQTWTRPISVAQDTLGGDQFLPALNVTAGQVRVAFLDTRSNPDGKADVYVAAVSSGRLGTAIQETRITTSPSDATRNNPVRDTALNLGTRLGLTVIGRTGVVVVWTDNRSGSEDVYLNR